MRRSTKYLRNWREKTQNYILNTLLLEVFRNLSLQVLKNKFANAIKSQVSVISIEYEKYENKIIILILYTKSMQILFRNDFLLMELCNISN